MTRFHHNCLASLLATLATTALAHTALAQGATITGTVRSAHGQALQAANVRLTVLNISVGTDADGAYRITVPPDRARGQSATLTVRAIGHRPQTKEVTIIAGVQVHDFTLDFDATRVSEVVVTGRDTARTKELAFTVDRVTFPRADRVNFARADTMALPAAANAFSQHLYPPELIMQNQSRLRVTESQREAILQEIYKVQATATQVQWRVSDESEKLNQLLERENAQESEVLAQADRMMTWEVAVKRAQLTMLIRIRNILTAEQRAMLRDLRRRE